MAQQDASSTQPPTLITRIKHSLRTIMLSVFGVLSAATIPVWQIYFVDTAEVDIEVTSIRRDISDQFTIPLDSDELLLLTPYLPESLRYEYNHLGERGDKIEYPQFPLEALRNAYEKAKQDLKNIAITKTKLQQHIAMINAYLDSHNTQFPLLEFRISTLKSWDLRNYIDDAEASYYESQVLQLTRNYTLMTFNAQQTEPEINTAALAYLLRDVKEDIQDVITESSQRHNQLRDSMRNLESQLHQLGEQQFDQHSYFNLNVVVTNSGRSSTSLRPLALLRVHIDSNNYVDIHLQLENNTRTQLDPASTQTLHFRSAALHHFPVDDQHIINTFWGSTGRAYLYVMDSQNQLYAANAIAFADNRNQKRIIDQLTRFAADHIH